MAGKLASLLIKISADGASAEKELRSLEKKMANTAKEFEKVGKTMSKYVTVPLTALAGVSVAAANTQVQAEAKLLNALKGREDVQKRLIAQAGELQSRSTLGDEAIIEQQAYLATLGLSEKQIGDTIEAAAQLSVALNMDLGSAVKNLAKTYGGMTGELGEGIPALKNLTKEQLQAGEAIKYVNDNYKGFAETAAQTGAGPLVQLKNTLGDVAEQFGVLLLPALQRVAGWLKSVAQWLQNLSPEWKKTIVTVGAVVAAIGPLAIAFSKVLNAIKLVQLAIPALKIAMSGMLGPIGAVVTAVTALAAAWINAKSMAREYAEEQKRQENDLARLEKEKKARAYDRYKELRSLNLSSAEIEKRLREALSALAKANDNEVGLEYVAVVDALQELRKVNLGGKSWAEDRFIAEQELQRLAKATNMQKEQLGIIGQLQKKISDLEKAKSAANSEEEIKRINGELEKTRAELERITELGNKTIVPKIEKPEGFEESALANSADLLTLTPKMNNTTLAPNEMSTYWQDFADKVKRSAELIDSVTAVIGSSLNDLATTMAEGLGDLFAGVEFDPGKALLEVLGKSLKSLGAALVTYATTMQAFKDALKRVFVDPISAILLGTGAIALGQMFVNAAKEPIKLANGGLAYGPTLAVVGDNRGAASDPEVIAPLSKLRNYMGGQQMELVGGVTFELRGDVARAIINRENVRLNRKG